jgi:TonB family protein
MHFLRTVASPIILLLMLQPSFAQESTRPAGPPSDSQQATHPAPFAAVAHVQGNLEVLTDTQGVDFGPYLSGLVKAVKANWYPNIPVAARPPLLNRGKVSIQFVVLPNGKVAAMQYTGSSGDIQLDRAAWDGIAASNPFSPLPKGFHGPYLSLRMHFYYNPQKSDLAGQ